MALINKPSYAELMESGSIDIAISPQTITIGSLLEHVRRGDVVKVHSLRRGSGRGARGDRAWHRGDLPRDRSQCRGAEASGGRFHRRDRARR